MKPTCFHLRRVTIFDNSDCQDCGGEFSTREVEVEDNLDIESDTYFELEMS